MSLYFLFNNVHFALEVLGAVSMLMAAWLTADTYSVKKDTLTLARAIGFGLLAIWQIIYAVSLGNDVFSYVGFAAYLIGLALILSSFVKKQALQTLAILVVPAFALWSDTLYAIAFLLAALIAYFSYRRSRDSMDNAQLPLSSAFVFLAIAALLAVFETENQGGTISMLGMVAEFFGFLALARWVWQYLELRIQESLVIILISTSLFLSTAVTLAFSMILINQVTVETESSLVTDVRVLDLTIQSLKELALAETVLISRDQSLVQAVASGDYAGMVRLSEELMEKSSLGFVTIASEDGSVLVRAHALSRRGDSLLGDRSFEEAINGNPFVTIEDSSVEDFSIRSGAPIISEGAAIGAVIAGYPLDNALVDNIKRVTGLEMFVYEGMVPVAATALAEDGRTRLTGVALSDAEIEKAVIKDGNTITARTELYGEPFHASYLPLANGDGKIVGMISAAKPEQDILDIANSTNRLTLFTVLLITLLSAFPIYFLTKRLGGEPL